MLVLSRCDGESVLVGNSIKVTVVATGAGQVKLGFEAPDDVLILREELVESIELEETGADRIHDQ